MKLSSQSGPSIEATRSERWLVDFVFFSIGMRVDRVDRGVLHTKRPAQPSTAQPPYCTVLHTNRWKHDPYLWKYRINGRLVIQIQRHSKWETKQMTSTVCRPGAISKPWWTTSRTSKHVDLNWDSIATVFIFFLLIFNEQSRKNDDRKPISNFSLENVFLFWFPFISFGFSYFF